MKILAVVGIIVAVSGVLVWLPFHLGHVNDALLEIQEADTMDDYCMCAHLLPSFPLVIVMGGLVGVVLLILSVIVWRNDRRDDQ